MRVEDYGLGNFSLGPIGCLNRLLGRWPHLQIVVSSDWRYSMSLDSLQEFYRTQGVVRPPIATTCKFGGYTRENYPQQRAAEILKYLEQHPSTGWVAVDDLDMRPWLQDNLILITRPTGLDLEAERQIESQLNSYCRSNSESAGLG